MPTFLQKQSTKELCVSLWAAEKAISETHRGCSYTLSLLICCRPFIDVTSHIKAQDELVSHTLATGDSGNCSLILDRKKIKSKRPFQNQQYVLLTDVEAGALSPRVSPRGHLVEKK